MPSRSAATCCSPSAPTPTRSRAWRSSPTTSAARTRRRSRRSTRSSSSTCAPAGCRRGRLSGWSSRASWPSSCSASTRARSARRCRRRLSAVCLCCWISRMPNLAELLTLAAERHGEDIALKLDDQELNYAFLNEGASRIAGLLKTKGIEPGDRVAIMLPNVPYFPVVYYGILRAGGVVVPMNVLLKGREVDFYVSDSGAKAVFVWHGFADACVDAPAEVIKVTPGEFEQLVIGADSAPENAERAGGDTAVILYTSGTTGTPKGAELSHDNLRTNCEVTARTLAELTPDDVILGALPLFHSFGQTCGLNAAVSGGAC